MTLPVWHLALLLAAPLLLGIPLTRLLRIGPRGDVLGFTAWSWMLGALAVAGLTFVWLACDRPIDGPWLAPLVFAAGVIGTWVTRSLRAEVGDAPRSRTREDRVLTITVAVLSAWILIRLFALNVQPVLFGDEANIFAQRAKVMFMWSGFDSEWMTNQALLDVKHSDYPIFDPLLHVWVYAGADRITHVDNRWPIQMFTFALLFALASALRRYVRPAIAAAIVVLFFGMGIFDLNIGPSRAEMILSTGILVTVDAWLRWQRTRQPAYWRLACVGLVATLLSKNEGQLLVVALICGLTFAWLVRARRLSDYRLTVRDALWLLLPGSILVGHHALNAHARVRNDLFDEHAGGGFFERFAAQFGERVSEVGSFFWNHLIADPSRFGLILPMLGLGVLIAPRRLLRGAEIVPIAMVVIALIGFQMVFVATPFDLAWHLPTAADRTVLHTMSVATLALGIAVAAVWPQLAARRPESPPAAD